MPKQVLPVEESFNAAQLYNPFTGSLQPRA